MATTDASARLVTKEKTAIKVTVILLLIGIWVMFALMLVGRSCFEHNYMLLFLIVFLGIVVLENTNKRWFYDVGVKTLRAC